MSQYVIKLNDDDVIINQDIDLAEAYCDVVFKVKQDGINTVNLQGLSFGFTLEKDGKVVHEFSYPPAGVHLVCSDMPYICAERVNWVTNDYYRISFWITQTGKPAITRTYDFLTPKPEQPSPACTWNNNKKQFEYPRQYPTDGKICNWDDRSKSWKPIKQYLSSMFQRRTR